MDPKVLPWAVAIFSLVVGAIPVKNRWNPGFLPVGTVKFLLELLKGVIPVFFLTQTGAELIEKLLNIQYSPHSSFLSWLAGLLVVIGQCYSPFVKKKEEKGLSTGLGVAMILAPWSAVSGIMGFMIGTLYFGKVPLASLLGILTAVMACLVLYPFSSNLWFGAITVFIITLRYEPEIDEILGKREKNI